MEGDGQSGEPGADFHGSSKSLEASLVVDCATPVITRIAGIDFVTVPLAHYRSILATAGADGPDAAPSKQRRMRLTNTHKDAEVRQFIQERLGTADLTEIRQAVEARFGAARTPSRSGLSRFSVQIREEAARTDKRNG